MKGLFITFEGRDNVGKSTQIDTLEAKLKEEGYNVRRMAFPSSEAIKKLLKANVSLTKKQKIFIEDQKKWSKLILESQLDDTIILCDRYDLSTIAYYMANKAKDKIGDTSKDFDYIYKRQMELRRPDYTFILTCSNGQAHIRKDELMDEIDNDEEFQELVSDCYAEIAYRMLTDRCDRTIAVVSTNVEKAVTEDRIFRNVIEEIHKYGTKE